jgi:hypothetical protein
VERKEEPAYSVIAGIKSCTGIYQKGIMFNLPRPLSYDWGTSTASGTNVGGMTPSRVKRLESYKE